MTLSLSPGAQRALAIGLALLTAAILAYAVAMPVMQAASLQSERVAMLRRQAQTLEGLVAVTPRYQEIARRLTTDIDSQSLIFVAAQPSLGVAALQGKLSQVFANAGITVSAAQTLPEVQADGLVKVSVQSTIQTDIGALAAALHEIGASRPLLQVERLKLREPDAYWATNPQSPAPTTANILDAEITVSAYMRQP